MLKSIMAIPLFILTHMVFAQPNTPNMESMNIPIALASGPAINFGTAPAIVFADSVSVPGASWLQLKFDDLLLGKAAAGKPETILRITSLLDGAVQTLNAESARQWRNQSAYFNGDTVLIEIIADPSAAESFLRASEILAGRPISNPPANKTICGDTDDRTLHNDPRVGRIIVSDPFPVWCSTFIIDDEQKCLLTSRSCATIRVVQFNVPLSEPNGALVHPHPNHQYTVDIRSIQMNTTVDEDWIYYGVYPNSNTGLTPFETQGLAFELGTPPSPTTGTVHVTGYGDVSDPVDPTWGGAQKTNSGSLVRQTDNWLYYEVDTTIADAGGPVIYQSTGKVIGINTSPTHEGCFNIGLNRGNAINSPDLTEALANPIGVCAPSPRLLFNYPDGLPDLVHPVFGNFPVEITPVPGYDLDPTTPLLHYSTDGGITFQTRSLVHRGGQDFLVEFPLMPCSTPIRFYISAETTDGIFETDKEVAPEDTYLTTTGVDTGWSLRWDFETQGGWTSHHIESTVDGFFERGTSGPRAFFTYAPLYDADGSGQCFMTGVEFGSDVDGGSLGVGNVWLRSPMITVPTLPSPDFFLWYSRYFNASDESLTGFDDMAIYVRPEGSPTILVEEVDYNSPSFGRWEDIKINLNGIVNQNQPFQVEFYVRDGGRDGVVEGAVDDVRISQYPDWSVCGGMANCGPDLNNDEIIDIADLNSTLDQWRGGSGSGDMNADQDVTVSDFVIFVKAFGNCPN